MNNRQIVMSVESGPAVESDRSSYKAGID